MTEAIIIAIVGGVVSLLVAVIPKLIESRSAKKNGMQTDIAEIKTKVHELKDDVEELKKDKAMQGDMIYQMLDHMATNNNTGNMKRCLDEYNAYFRKD